MSFYKIQQQAPALNRQQQLQLKGGTSDTNGNVSSSTIIIDMDEIIQ